MEESLKTRYLIEILGLKGLGYEGKLVLANISDPLFNSISIFLLLLLFLFFQTIKEPPGDSLPCLLYSPLSYLLWCLCGITWSQEVDVL